MKNRTPGSRRDPEFRAIEEKAAEWFGRFEMGLAPAEERELLRWLETDPRHSEAMREMDDTWDFLDALKKIPRMHAPVPILAERRGIVRFAPALVGAAALVAVVFFASWPSWNDRSFVRQTVTEVGGMKKIELPDGSVVHVNGNSSVAVRFTRTERRLELQRGEAHFAVAKDAARPFVVVAGEVAVKAVGTIFNVRRDLGGIEVFVTEGKVRLDDAGRGDSLLPRAASISGGTQPGSMRDAESEVLVAGQRALVPLQLTATTASVAASAVVVAAIAPSQIQEALAWQARQLEFDQMPLAQVVADFNRYNSHQLAIADADLALRPFGGSFRADNLQVFVQLLEERFGVVAERGEEKTILRSRGR